MKWLALVLLTASAFAQKPGNGITVDSGTVALYQWGEQDLPYSASVSFAPTAWAGTVALNGNMAFSIAAGAKPGQDITLYFFHDATSNLYIVTPANNVKGFLTPTAKPNTYSVQTFKWVAKYHLWIAKDMGLTDQVYQ